MSGNAAHNVEAVAECTLLDDMQSAMYTGNVPSASKIIELSYQICKRGPFSNKSVEIVHFGKYGKSGYE